MWQDVIPIDCHPHAHEHPHPHPHPHPTPLMRTCTFANTGRYFDSGDAFSGAGKKEDPLESAVEKRETLAVVQGQLDSESSEAAKVAAEVARKNAAAEAAFKKKFGNMKPSAGALLHRQRKHEVSLPCCAFLPVPVGKRNGIVDSVRQHQSCSCYCCFLLLLL